MTLSFFRPARFLLIAAIPFLFGSCGESAPFPPEPVSRAGLLRNDDGIYMSIDSTVLFADMPAPFRNFYGTHCSECHSSGRTDGAKPQPPRIDTWAEARAYGPSRLLLAALSGAMPPAGAPAVPESTLAALGRWLATGTGAGVDTPDSGLVDVTDPWVREYVRLYCADCHTRSGTHPNRARAHLGQPMDKKDDVAFLAGTFSRRLIPPYTGDRMPPANYFRQPREEDNLRFIAWIRSISTTSAAKRPAIPAGASFQNGSAAHAENDSAPYSAGPR